jgi:hypothetical protein
MLDIVIYTQNNKMSQYNVLEDPPMIKTISKDYNLVNNIYSTERVTY